MLFNRYLSEWRGQKPELWWPKYVEIFTQELKTEKKLSTLRHLFKLVKSGKVIGLACFCKDARFCHRTLVGEFLRGYGIEVKEFRNTNANSQAPHEQLSIFG